MSPSHVNRPVRRRVTVTLMLVMMTAVTLVGANVKELWVCIALGALRESAQGPSPCAQAGREAEPQGTCSWQ